MIKTTWPVPLFVFVALGACSYRFRPQYKEEGTSIQSPDGRLTLAIVIDDHDHGLGSPPYLGVMVASSDQNVLNGELAIWGGDFRARWAGPRRVQISPRCDGFNSIWYEQARTTITAGGEQIAIDLMPPEVCSAVTRK